MFSACVHPIQRATSHYSILSIDRNYLQQRFVVVGRANSRTCGSHLHHPHNGPVDTNLFYAEQQVIDMALRNAYYQGIIADAIMDASIIWQQWCVSLDGTLIKFQ